MKCLVIGVGGCSNGGKTTLSNGIRKALSNVIVMGMDDFYREDGDPKIELLDVYNKTFANWDSLNSFNGPKFLKAFEDNHKKLSESSEMKILIVEGIFVFMFSEIQKYFFKRYFIDLPYPEALRRRRLRKYPRDEPDDYFEKVAWPAYKDIREEAKAQKDIICVDGTDSESEILQFVLEDIKAALPQEGKKAAH